MTLHPFLRSIDTAVIPTLQRVRFDHFPRGQQTNTRARPEATVRTEPRAQTRFQFFNRLRR
jgi:hypothetical protein